MKTQRLLQRLPPFERAVLVLYAARAVLGWLVALPVIRVVGQSGIAALPEGDAALFQDGALWLLELLREQEKGLRAAFETSSISGLVALSILSVPSVLLFATAPRALERSPAWPRALSIAPRFLVVGVLEVVVLLLTVLVFSMASSGLTPLGAWLSERAEDGVVFALCLPGAFVVGFALIVADLTRAGLVRDDARVIPAIARALSEFREAPGPLFAGFVLASGASALLVAVVARAAELCRIQEPGGLRIALVLLLHQGALLGLVAIKAFWIRRVDAFVR